VAGRPTTLARFLLNSVPLPEVSVNPSPSLVLLLAACSSLPTGGETGNPSASGLTCSTVDAVCATSAVADTASGPETLAVSDMGGGTIHVVHTNFQASCCLGFNAAATAGADRIDIAYTEVGDPCDCMCPYTLDYSVEGVAAGTYEVYAGGTDATVTVE
jgi:hypothetical protein